MAIKDYTLIVVVMTFRFDQSNLHFFNVVHFINLVQVQAGEKTIATYAQLELLDKRQAIE